MDIKITYTLDSLFGDVDPETEKINVDASIDQYNSMVEAAVLQEYPGSQVSVKCTSRARVTIDGDPDSYDALHIQDVEAGIWSDWEWIVK